MSTTAGTSLKQWQDNWAECNRRYVAMATENESLQSQLAAANEQIRRLWPAKLSAAPCSICGYNGPGYYQAETHPCAAQKADADAPVPAQPAVVPKHAADWFHDMREVLFDIATSDVICDRPEHAFVTVAIDRDTLSRAAILSTTDTEVKK